MIWILAAALFGFWGVSWLILAAMCARMAWEADETVRASEADAEVVSRAMVPGAARCAAR